MMLNCSLQQSHICVYSLLDCVLHVFAYGLKSKLETYCFTLAQNTHIQAKEVYSCFTTSVIFRFRSKLLTPREHYLL